MFHRACIVSVALGLLPSAQAVSDQTLAQALARTPAEVGLVKAGLGGPVLVQAQTQRPLRPLPLRPLRPADRRSGYQEPAYARGYADGYRRGTGDGRDRDRYDPVGHKDYRDGDQGYSSNYGSRDAYRNNYRAGFRQGYEEGYRETARGKR